MTVKEMRGQWLKPLAFSLCHVSMVIKISLANFAYFIYHCVIKIITLETKMQTNFFSQDLSEAFKRTAASLTVLIVAGGGALAINDGLNLPYLAPFFAVFVPVLIGRPVFKFFSCLGDNPHR